MQYLLDHVSSPGAGTSIRLQPNRYPFSNRTFQGVVSGTGAVTANISIQCSNDNTNWLPLVDIILSGTDVDTDGYVSNAQWSYVRAYLNSITGTEAQASVIMGV